tara:strand:+ start:2202 stop:2405 length:204 start_codon:yes stop_codon:yes gene_type:complete
MKLTKSTLKRIIREELQANHLTLAETEEVTEDTVTEEEDETVEETVDPAARITKLEEELKALKASLK